MSSSFPVQQYSLSDKDNFSKEFIYYLCESIVPIPLAQMVELLMKSPDSSHFKIVSFDEIYLIENYFVLVSDKVGLDSKIRSGSFRSYFVIFQKVRSNVASSFLDSLVFSDINYQVNQPVVIPLVHRHFPGRIQERLPNSRFRIKYNFPLNPVKDYFVVVHKSDMVLYNI